ncbi:MAG: 4Fe-4S binding protein, partial [Nitrospira sp.]|nr:4Fe-4S binding protein [Nitrospira sp.]
MVQALFFAGFVALFVWVCWPYGGTDYARHREAREVVAAEFFLILDPLVSLSTAIASRSWVWSLTAAGVILAVCVFIPRGFCGYVCPLGTMIDLFDWAIGRRVNRWKLKDVEHDRRWWVHLKYYLLLACLVAAGGGVLITGFFAAIPIVTRAFLFLVKPVELGVTRGWYLNTGFNAGHVVSVLLFLGILGLGLLRRRFWCQYLCPSGAVFSLGNLWRVTERKVESSCIHCNRCVEICPFDAIKPDYTTRTADCTLCQTCGGVCPTHSIFPPWSRLHDDRHRAEQSPLLHIDREAPRLAQAAPHAFVRQHHGGREPGAVDGVPRVVERRMDPHELDRVVPGRLAFIDAQLARLASREGQAGRFDARQAHPHDPLLFHGQSPDRAGRTHLSAVVAGRLASRPVRHHARRPKRIPAVLESSRLQDVVGAGLETLAAPDAGLEKLGLGQAAGRPHWRRSGRAAPRPRGGNGRPGRRPDQEAAARGA